MGVLFICVYLVIILTVIEINTTFFVMTGLERKIARFQVISMLTGTGFTTGESELIIDHPIRRRLGAFLILFGAFSLAVIISAISNLLTDNFYTLEITYVAAGLIGLLFFLRTPSIQRFFGNKLKKEIKEYYELADLPISDVLLLEEDDEVREISIKKDSPYTGKTFEEIINQKDDLILLFIKRGDLNIRYKATQTKLEPGDRIIIYGNNPLIKKRFENGA